MSAAAKRVRWVCPRCGSGKLGPSRPRRDATVRFCLPCSEETETLVQREAPSLERKRAAKAKRANEKRRVRAERERKKSVLELQDASYRNVEVDVLREVQRIAQKANCGWGFGITWNRRSDGLNSGRAWANRLHLSIGSDSLEEFCSLVAHELAHVNAPRGTNHGEKWLDEYERICATVWDTKPVFRLALDHRYAIDREIVEQLKATSRGEYRRSKAPIPLAGTVVSEWDEEGYLVSSR